MSWGRATRNQPPRCRRGNRDEDKVKPTGRNPWACGFHSWRRHAMNLRSFLKAGHTPTLFCAFLYFDISFMVWVLIGALAKSIVPYLGLDDAQRGLMVAIPLLGGAILRVVLGLMTDRIGARLTGIIGLML